MDDQAAAGDVQRAGSATGWAPTFWDGVSEPAFERLARLAAKLLDTPTAVITLVEAIGEPIRDDLGLPEPRASRPQALWPHAVAREVVATGRPLTIPDVRRRLLTEDLDAAGAAYLGLPLRAGDGQVLGVLGVIDDRPRDWSEGDVETLGDLAAACVAEITLRRDMTARRRAEGERAQLAAIVESSNDAIIAKDLQGRITHWNDGAERLYGYTADEVLGQSIELLSPPERHEEVAQFLDRIASGERIPPYETVRVCKDGRRVEVALSLSPVKDPAGAIVGAAVIARDVTRRNRDERDRQFLAEVSGVLASSLDYETTLTTAARLAVPQIADWCVVRMVDESGQLRPLTLAHVDPAKVVLAEELSRRYPPNPDEPGGPHDVLRTGKPVFLPEITAELLEQSAQGPEHLAILKELVFRSYICVPLVARGRTLGTLSFVTAESGRTYGPEDLAMAEDLARRAALAVDNARLYREAQDALRRQADSQTLVDALLAAAPVAVAFLDRELRYVRVNSYLAEINGLPIAEHLGRTVREVLGSVADPYEPMLWGVLESGHPRLNVELVGEMRGRPGTRSHWLGNFYPAFDVEGHVVGVGVMMADVTAVRHIEEELRISHERLDLVLWSTGLGLWYCDLPFDKLRWNPRCKEHFGLPPDAEVTLDTFYARLHPEDRERTRAAIDQAIAQHEDYDIEYRTVSPDDRQRWIRAIGRCFYNETGTPIRFDGVTVDMTERRRIEETLREADRRKDEFLAMLAHELRNPLAAINGAVRLARTPSESGQSDWAHQVITRQVQHLAHLIDDLLDVSRITRGKVQLRPTLLDAVPILRHAVESVRPFIQTRKHELTVVIGSGPLLVNADATRLEQIAVNLLNNAAKYTEPGGRVHLAAGVEGADLVIRVRDNGIGIPPEMLSRIFDLFAQVDCSLDRSQGGLGIGLTLVKSLAEMHGGSISALSAGLGQGSEFVVRLPRPLNLPTSVPAPKVAGPSSRRRLRVLVVDDSADTARSLARLLEVSGHEARTAHDGFAAFDVARPFRPEAVLLDLGLPGMDGYQVAEGLRRDPDLANVLLVAVSGYAQEQDRLRSRAVGFDHHLVKPVNFDALLDLLDRDAPK